LSRVHWNIKAPVAKARPFENDALAQHHPKTTDPSDNTKKATGEELQADQTPVTMEDDNDIGKETRLVEERTQVAVAEEATGAAGQKKQPPNRKKRSGASMGHVAEPTKVQTGVRDFMDTYAPRDCLDFYQDIKNRLLATLMGILQRKERW
jgi:hypothetical protein